MGATGEGQAGGEAWPDTGYVFTTAEGNPILPKNVTRDFIRIRKRAKVPTLPLHALRLTAVSLQIAAGVPLPTISKRIGHKQYGLMVNQYGHLLPEADQEAAQAVDALIERRQASCLQPSPLPRSVCKTKAAVRYFLAAAMYAFSL